MNAFTRRGFLGTLTAGTSAAKGAIGRIAAKLGQSSGTPNQSSATHRIQAPNITLELSSDGEIARLIVGEKNVVWPVAGITALKGFERTGTVQMDERKEGGVRFTRKLTGEIGGQQKQLTLTESFYPTMNSIRWEMRIDGEGPAWSTPIETRLNFSRSKEKKFWTAWGDPEPDRPGMKSEGWPGVLFGAFKLLDSKEGPSWNDPLVTRPFRDRSFWYGAVTYDYTQTTNFYTPIFNDVICIPMATVIDEQNGVGLTVALALDDVLLDLTLQTTAAGGITFSRLFRRIAEGSPVEFAMDLVAHEPDWRGGLRWITERYPEYFHPPLASAGELGGTGAYSSYEGELDADKLKRMAFTLNWKASFDYPYQGLWMPPVPDGEKWTRLKPWTDEPRFYIGHSTSVPQMADYSRRMRKAGFYVLNYYDFAEFGTHMVYPPQPFRRSPSDPDFWQDPNDFCYANFADAILFHSEKVSPRIQLQADDSGRAGPVQVGWPWADFILDWGEPSWQNFLLDQAQKLVDKIPESSGMCIDRLDFVRLYNFRRDDGVTWYDGPARSMVVAWKDFSAKLGDVQHRANQALFVNNHVKRIDILKHVDGLFDEHGDYGQSKNLTAMLGMFKPTIEWVQEASKLKPDPDTFMQRFIYLGMFPVAPYPQNDHCILPNADAEKLYMDYGPMLAAMRGRKWCLLPNSVECDGNARANLFTVPGGYIIPLMFGEGNATVTLRGLPGLAASTKIQCTSIRPGESEWQESKFEHKDGTLRFRVPLHRGCAMLRIRL